MNKQLQRLQREDTIIQTLNELGYATQKQLQRILPLAGTRNAHRILYEMERSRLIRSARRECKVYYVSHKGKGRVGASTSVRKGMIDHALLVTECYLFFGQPDTWEKERPIKVGDDTIIPDATFKQQGRYVFVEADYAQSMPENIKKLDQYQRLSEAVQHQFRYEPLLVFYTVHPNRKPRVKEECKKRNIKCKVYVHKKEPTGE